MAAAANKNAEPSEPNQRELAELSALADGTLEAGRRAEVQARIAHSVELSALYKRERRAVEVLRQAQTATGAPAALRARLVAERGRRRGIRLRPAYGGGLVVGLATVLIMLVLVLPGGTPGAPSVSQAAALASRGSTAPAPAVDPGDPADKLALSVGRVYFPNWGSAFGWRAVGQRVDHLDGHLAITVYYEWQGRRIAYTVLAAPALRQPASAVSQVDGTPLRTLRLHGRVVVTWRRAGETCVLSGVAVAPSDLQELAAWAPVGG
jgi:hypothetical protein